MAFVYVLLSAANSLLIAHFLKKSESESLSTLKVLIINYIAAILAAISVLSFSGQPLIPDSGLWFWLLVMFTGVLFISTFFLYSKSVHRNGVGITVAAMRISLLVPVMLSIIVYNEPLTIVRIIGITLVIISLYLLILGDSKKNGVSSAKMLITIFLLTGIGDSTLKIFERHGLLNATEAHFVGYIYFFALITGLIILFLKKDIRFNVNEIKTGILVGIPNFLSSFFLLKALSLTDATIVYVITNITIVMGGILLGVVYWKDKPTVKQSYGLVTALFALFILIWA